MTDTGMVQNDTYFRFDSGQMIITPPAKDLMQRYRIDPHRLLEMHCSGDWGDQSDQDKKAWDKALKRLMCNKL
jgi:hypothetical protein